MFTNADSAQHAQRRLGPHEAAVGNPAAGGQNSGIFFDRIKNVAVDYEQKMSIQCSMFSEGFHADIAEGLRRERAEACIVVSRDKDDLHPFLSAFQQRLDDSVVGVGPVQAPPHGPEIDDIPHKVNARGVPPFEKFGKTPRPTNRSSEVYVGQKNGTSACHGNVQLNETS